MLHIDGFDQFADEGTLANALGRSGYTSTGTLAVVAGRSAGSSALAMQKGSVGRQFAWAGQKFSLGFAHQFSARGSCLKLQLGTEALVLWFNPDTGLPMVNDAQGNALPTANTWYYYELELDRAAGTLTLLINGKVDSVFLLTAQMKGATQIQLVLGYVDPATYRIGVVPVPADNATKNYDDFYVRGDARLGPIVITTRFPTVDSHVQWYRAGDEITHAATVSKLPPTPLNNYIASETVGQEDRFTSNKALTNTNEIVATGTVVLARKSNSLNAHLNVFMGQAGGAEVRQSTLTVDSNWISQYSCYEKVDSDTVAKIQASQFGVAVVN